MKCPRCGKPLVILELDKVEVDHCLACQGVWFDWGELELLVGLKSEIPLVTDNVSKEPALRCPRCGRKMEKVRSHGDGEVLLDRCKKRHGLWFDGDELEALLRDEKTGVDNRISEHLRGIFIRKAESRNGGEKR
jgi:Zn-finger nucleic acid-binding protein